MFLKLQGLYGDGKWTDVQAAIGKPRVWPNTENGYRSALALLEIFIETGSAVAYRITPYSL